MGHRILDEYDAVEAACPAGGAPARARSVNFFEGLGDAGRYTGPADLGAFNWWLAHCMKASIALAVKAAAGQHGEASQQTGANPWIPASPHIADWLGRHSSCAMAVDPSTRP